MGVRFAAAPNEGVKKVRVCQSDEITAQLPLDALTIVPVFFRFVATVVLYHSAKVMEVLDNCFRNNWVIEGCVISYDLNVAKGWPRQEVLNDPEFAPMRSLPEFVKLVGTSTAK